MRFIFFVVLLGCIACGSGDGKKNYKVIADLPFYKAVNGKEFADLIIKSIRTNRALPIWQEFEDNSGINKDSLRMIVGMYSTAIGGRNDWEYIDVYKFSEQKDGSEGYDYAWLDPSGRLAFQIRVIPLQLEKGYDLAKIEFRSRLDVMESKAVPGGKISEYEKLKYDWEANMKRKLEEQKNKANK